MDATDEDLLYLSVLTLGEIRKGVARLAQGKRRTHLETRLEVDLEARFSGRILLIDSFIADRWGFAGSGIKTEGESLSVIDGLLAAIALGASGGTSGDIEGIEGAVNASA